MLYVLLYIYCILRICTLYVFKFYYIFLFSYYLILDLCDVFLFSLYAQNCNNVKLLKKLSFNDSNFLCYMKFFIIRFSHAFDKILSSICEQDIVKPELHYQINLIRLISF